MSAARSHHQRREPQRTCVGCREVQGKRSMIRVVRSPDGVKIDLTGKLAGRGAYIHNRRTCWEEAIKASLGRALKVELDEVAIAILSEYMNTLPDEQNG